MKINLEILASAIVYAPKEISELNTKELVPKMMVRRRLTRASKIAIYLASEVGFEKGRILYGSSFGELSATAKILDAIGAKESISPTHFQNSVYNTAVSYLSMLYGNSSEIMTISSGDKTAINLLKAGAIKALDGDEILLLATETLNIPKIDEVNSCLNYLEAGVALKVRLSQEKGREDWSQEVAPKGLPKSLIEMFAVAKFDGQKNIIEVKL